MNIDPDRYLTEDQQASLFQAFYKAHKTLQVERNRLKRERKKRRRKQ